MRLVVVSHTPHYRNGERTVGWGPTVRELDHLASLFDEVRHIAPVHEGKPPASSRPYSAANLELVPVRPAGADGFLGKLDALSAVPRYVRAIQRELRSADMVHIRAPANIALVALVLMRGTTKPAARWIKYAGNWQPSGRESPSYTLQRLLLARGGHRAVVTVNGWWPNQPPWIRTFANPSLDAEDLERGRQAARTKQVTSPIRLVYVGQLLDSKGGGRAIDVLGRLRARGIDATLTLFGDGPEREAFAQIAQRANVADHVTFAGWRSPPEVAAGYANAHFVILPSASEGWPKVLSEGMAYGALPIAGAVSSIPQYIERFRVGTACAPTDCGAFADAIASYIQDPLRWRSESMLAVEAASEFSFQRYIENVRSILREFGLRPEQ